MVATTSAQAYIEIQNDGTTTTQREKIVEFLSGLSGPTTRRHIGQALGMELGAVSGRINGLMKDELVQEDGVSVDPLTSRTVKLVSLI